MLASIFRWRWPKLIRVAEAVPKKRVPLKGWSNMIRRHPKFTNLEEYHCNNNDITIGYIWQWCYITIHIYNHINHCYITIKPLLYNHYSILKEPQSNRRSGIEAVFFRRPVVAGAVWPWGVSRRLARLALVLDGFVMLFLWFLYVFVV